MLKSFTFFKFFHLFIPSFPYCNWIYNNKYSYFAKPSLSHWQTMHMIFKYDYTKYIIISYVSTSTTIFTHIFPFLRIFNIVYTKKQFFIWKLPINLWYTARPTTVLPDGISVVHHFYVHSYSHWQVRIHDRQLCLLPEVPSPLKCPVFQNNYSWFRW